VDKLVAKFLKDLMPLGEHKWPTSKKFSHP